MKSAMAATLVILASLLAPHASAAPPIRAKLTLPHDTVLPGVPFDLVVTYENVSKQPVTIGGAVATLVVTFENGETMVMHNPGSNDQWNMGDAQLQLQLAPGESVQQAASWEHGSIPNWFKYASYSGPGTYGIALQLQIVDYDGNRLGTVRTPAVTLTRVVPARIDAELWKRMQEAPGGWWADNWFAAKKEGVALANEIIQLHPTSGYYPYALALRAYRNVVDKNDISLLLEAAERFRNSPAYPYLLNAAANSARYAGTVAEREARVAEAKMYFTLAETKYREALATKSVAIRASSEQGLLQVAHGLDRTNKPAR